MGTHYRYRGAAALVLLHERHLKQFIAYWRVAKAIDLSLPESADPAYASLEDLLRHVLGDVLDRAHYHLAEYLYSVLDKLALFQVETSGLVLDEKL